MVQKKKSSPSISSYVGGGVYLRMPAWAYICASLMHVCKQ